MAPKDNDKGELYIARIQRMTSVTLVKQANMWEKKIYRGALVEDGYHIFMRL